MKYEVKWKGYKKTTWESASIMKEDVPLLVADFHDPNASKGESDLKSFLECMKPKLGKLESLMTAMHKTDITLDDLKQLSEKAKNCRNAFNVMWDRLKLHTEDEVLLGDKISLWNGIQKLLIEKK